MPLDYIVIFSQPVIIIAPCALISIKLNKNTPCVLY
jgi:hypothetical protein